jgi:YidC/Oxa1 family membrane protein insertase
MPILMGLFYLLRNPGMYVGGERIILASHEAFWWLGDLSQPDMTMILPLITGVTTFLSMSMTGMMGAGGGGDMAATMGPMMKVMRIFMPVFIVVIARQMPAGLAIYWMVGNLFTVGQTLLLKRMRKKATEAHMSGKKE